MSKKEHVSFQFFYACVYFPSVTLISQVPGNLPFLLVLCLSYKYEPGFIQVQVAQRTSDVSVLTVKHSVINEKQVTL